MQKEKGRCAIELTQKQIRLRILIMAGLLLLLFLLSFVWGRYEVPIGQVVRILGSRVFALTKDWSDAMEAAVLRVRLPRILLSALVGCSLAAAGSAYQGVFQNPMASPDILGASSGAAFGAALAILLGWRSQGITRWPLCSPC